MAINISALNAFRGAAQWNNDAVANLSGDGISSPGLYEGKFEFDLSNKDEAKLTSVNFKQTV